MARAGAMLSVCLSPSFLPAENNEPYMKIPCSDSKITSAVWGPLGEFIIAGHESGELNQFSAKVGATRGSISISRAWGGRCSIPEWSWGRTWASWLEPAASWKDSENMWFP